MCHPYILYNEISKPLQKDNAMVCIRQTYSVLPNIINIIIPRGIKGRGHVACMGEDRNPCSVLVGKSDG
jgi:hypothetical protein